MKVFKTFFFYKLFLLRTANAYKMFDIQTSSASAHRKTTFNVYLTLNM